MSLSTTEHAAAIRATLKAKHGWSSRDVSVRADHYSLGSSIDIRIKSPTVPLATVRAVAEPAERISRCHVTGEILSGGNRYVHVSYTREALKALGAPFEAAVKAAVDAVEPGSNSLHPIEGTPYLVGRPTDWRVSLWGDHHLADYHVNALDEIAAHVGRLQVPSVSP